MVCIEVARGTHISDIQPFLDLWHPTIIWRGVLYSVLMGLAKLVVGLPILAYPVACSLARTTLRKLQELTCIMRSAFPRLLHLIKARKSQIRPQSPVRESTLPHNTQSPATGDDKVLDRDADLRIESTSPPESSLMQVTASIPAATFMGIAMVARGEIGLLIAQLARGDGSPTSPGLLGDEAFVVCIWAILICTLIGPIGTGVAVRHWGPRLASGLWA